MIVVLHFNSVTASLNGLRFFLASKLVLKSKCDACNYTLITHCKLSICLILQGDAQTTKLNRNKSSPCLRGAALKQQPARGRKRKEPCTVYCTLTCCKHPCLRPNVQPGRLTRSTDAELSPMIVSTPVKFRSWSHTRFEIFNGSTSLTLATDPEGVLVRGSTSAVQLEAEKESRQGRARAVPGAYLLHPAGRGSWACL